MRLIGREGERAAMDGLVAALRAGESRALVIHGQPGVGKTALLEYVASVASDCQVLSVAGMQSELELAFAGLHQLCSPLLDRLDLIPPLQREALQTTFGMSSGPTPDRFLVGLAVLSLLAEVAAARPLLCLIDDEQWVDRASAQILAFVARRLGAESVGLVFAARVPNNELAGLPGLLIPGLKREQARELLKRALPGPVDAQVVDEIIAETEGNPLALLELPRVFSAAELAGGFGLPGAVALSDGIGESFQRRVDALNTDTRRLLLIAAAEPLGDPLLLWRAAASLGIDPTAARQAVDSGLAEFAARVRFRHPLVRSVVYGSASAEDRSAAHRALAEVTDSAIDPDRRAWHRAYAALGPDEDIAVELIDTASRAQARGGFAAAAAFLTRATELTPNPAQRARRALEAAQTKVQAGALNAALELLAVAEAGPPGELEHARTGLVRAQIAFVTYRGGDAPHLLLKAAQRLEPVAPDLARATYLEALAAAAFAGGLAGPGGSVLDVARAISIKPVSSPTTAELLLEGMAANSNQGYTAGLSTLRRAVTGVRRDVPAYQGVGVMTLACVAAAHVWDDDACDEISDQWSRICRETGALSDLPLALHTRAWVLVLTGDLAGAALVVDEVHAAIEAMDINFGDYGALALAAYRGDETAASIIIDASVRDGFQLGEGTRVSAAEWANAVLNNGLGRYEQALAAAQRAIDNPWKFVFVIWAIAELIEAATRSGRTAEAANVYPQLAEMTVASGTDWALGVQARAQGLLSKDEEAEPFYTEAIERLGRTRIRTELARAHLLYGEWLRRQRRRGEARLQLRTALHMLEAMGMGAFADRARRELRLTGERARKRSVNTLRELTTQEAQVAKLARDGLSNPEIGIRLYISPRTVEYHLSKVFAKLGITKRSQLGRVLM